MSTESIVADLDFFDECLDQLAVELVKSDLDVQDHQTNWFGRDSPKLTSPKEPKIKKSAWVASVLASSDEDEHKRKALAFGILSYTKYKDTGTEKEDLYERYLYIILSRVGNLPAFDNVRRTEATTTFQSRLLESVDSVLSMELESNLDKNEIEGGWVLSRFQKEIYDHLTAGRNLAISGPTSSGKSFILRRYIERRADEDEQFEGIYVVPTRALISEVSRKLSALHEDINVRTGAHFEEAEDEISEDTFLVVTPERCRKLIDPDVRGQIDPELVFFDEVQNIEDNERGVLFETIIQSLNEYYPSAQIVAAGPYLANPGEALESLIEGEVKEVKSAFTPVLQLKVSLQFQRHTSGGNDLSVNIHSPSGEIRNIQVSTPEELTYTDVNQSKTQSLPIILEEYGEGSKNLVYSGRKDYAEDRANVIAERKGEKSYSSDIEDLKEFLKNAVHEDYSLISCLEKGVAYHHGMVPKIAREEIEEIYSDTGHLDTIVTTPTLLQGVNLPAEKIFLVGAKRGQKELTDFEFGNLIGRVGRVDTKLYGAIYCIETEDDEWADEKLESTEEKEIESATSKATDATDELVDALKSKDLSSVSKPSVKYTAVLLRGRFLKQGQSVEGYLKRKGMDDSDVDEIEAALEWTLGDIDIPNEILREHPTVDPVQQDVLYKNIKQYPEMWSLGNGPYDFSYEEFLEITRRLNQIFKFSKDGEDVIPEHSETGYGGLVPIVVNAAKWLRGESYQSMIESRQDVDSVDDESIDESIREVLELVDRDIGFVLVKYFGILTTILEYLDYEASNWMLQFDQMLEMGSMDFNELRLMSKGVDRSVAVDIPIPDGIEDPVEYLQENPGVIPSFYKRHLKKQGIL